MATTQTKAQQDFINQARKSKAQTVKDNLAASTVAHELEENDTSYWQFVKSYYASLGLPDWKRMLLSSITSMCVGAGVGYATSALLGTFLAAYTGSMFIAVAIAVIAFVIGAYLAVKCATKAFMYVASSTIDQDIAAIRNKFASWIAAKQIA